MSYVMYDADDVESLRLVAYKEARGDGISGMHAVMHSVMNRVAAVGFPKMIHEVIYQKNAYSSMSRPDDVQFDLQPVRHGDLWMATADLAAVVLAGNDPDPTKHPISGQGACYYANLSNIDKGGWFERIISGPNGWGTAGHAFTVTIGHHSYFL